MDPNFLKWILETQFNFREQNRQDFLEALKSNPKRVKTFIHNQLQDWTVVAAFKLVKVIAIPNYDKAVEEILEAVKKHFAADLAPTS